MTFAGIIAEYDPFHSGHAWQLAAARALGARRVAVALSCGLTQRGMLPLLPERTRTAAALRCGADLVFALPAPYACAGAERFAQAGVALLAAAGCDALVFGAETPDAALLMAGAGWLLSEEYRTALRRELDGSARSFAAARQQALRAVSGDERLAALAARPNDNLALEYCKAILAQNAPLTPVPLPRQGADHGQALSPGGQYASASALRSLWAENSPQSVEAVAPYLPGAALPLCREALEAGRDTDFSAAGLALLSRLRGLAACEKPFSAVRGVSEGLDHRLLNALRTAPTADALYDRLTNARYPRARMRRLCMDAALGYTDTLPALPPYLHLLGGRRDALPLLAGRALPAGPSLARLAGENAACRRVAEAQAAAADFGSLCRRTPGPMGLAYTEKPVLPD